jgi:anthraniloyl-CoA monooxygenase
VPFRAGSRKPPSARTDAIRPRLSLLRPDETRPDTHLRWRPQRSDRVPA